MCKLSIIMTVKNGEDTIGETLSSILNQRFKDFECIIVDDGSKDRTRQIIEEINDSRIKYYSTTGVGRSRALNMALNKATGSYVANNDVDDPMHPDKLYFMNLVLEKNPNIGVLYTDTILLTDNEIPKWDSYSEDYSYKLEILDDKLLMKRNPIPHSAVMFNLNQIKHLKYNEKILNNVDYELWFRLMKASHVFCRLNLKLSSKRIHKNQSYENKSRRRYLNNSVRVQINGIRLLQGSKKYILMAYLRYLYGLLPNKIRMFRYKIKEL